MAEERVEDFPIFPLGLVALPSETVPLHIFEERYRTMIAECLDNEREFGIVWTDEDGAHATGCAMEVTEVTERSEDGRMNIITRGTRPFRVVEERHDLPYPAAVIEFLDDAEIDDASDDFTEAHAEACEAYADLVEQATDKQLEPEELAAKSAYEMAATVEFGAEAKQGLLDLRSEAKRIKLVGQLLRATVKRLEFVERAQVRAASNGRVRFG